MTAWPSMSVRERHHDLETTHVRTRRELIAARREIALGKLTELQHQCERLSRLVAEGIISRVDAADGLFDAAIGNDLVSTYGVDYIQNCLAKTFGPVASAPAGSAT